MRTQTRRTDDLTRIPADRYLVYWALVTAGTSADLYSKHTVFAALGYPKEATPWLLDGWLGFRLFTDFNKGALWGFGQGLTWLFASLSIVAFVGVVYWLFARGAALSRWLTVALGLITSGTLGNLYDRLGLHGCLDEYGNVLYAVRDFLHVRFGDFDWAVFKLADSFLVTGAMMLVVQSFLAEAPDTVQAVSGQHATDGDQLTESATHVA